MQRESAPTPPPSEKPQARNPSPARILVVDDNNDIVRVIQRILSAEGYEILTANNGETALELALEKEPDLLLLDVMLPKIDGLEVCRELKNNAETSGMMIILVTGRGSLDHLVEGFNAGADDYIPKPFHIPELLARTRSALRIKRLTDDLAERNRQLEARGVQLVQKEKMATIGLLASGIAHEFNNIMAGICSYAQLAKKVPEYKEKLVDVAMTQTQRALELTKSLSTYNRARIDEAHCNISEVVRGSLCLVAKHIQKSGITVHTDIDESLCVKISPGQMQEIILNLVINAIQAMEGRGGNISIRACAKSPSVVKVQVSDNGVGIPADDLPRIFDPFFTTKGALGGGAQSGTGLGLTVCYNVIQAHAGEIEVTSDPGKGTTFHIALPLSPQKKPAAPRESLLEQECPVPTSGLRVLVVDDEEPAQQVLKAYLEEQEVVCCSTVEKALEEYSKAPFDFVILDICLQGSINGFEAFDRFSSFQPAPRIIFASGCFPDDTYRAYLKKAHGHLLKPFKLEDLSCLLYATRETSLATSGETP